MFTERSYGIIPFARHDTEPVYLLIRHKSGHWSIPKGHKVGDEDDTAAAIRELEEETGITGPRIIAGPFIERYVYTREHQQIHKEVHFYLAEVDRDAQIALQAEEVRDFAWLEFKEALERLTFPESKEVLIEAAANLQ